MRLSLSPAERALVPFSSTPASIPRSCGTGECERGGGLRATITLRITGEYTYTRRNNQMGCVKHRGMQAF